jgi:hypothetical protein
MDSTTLLFLVVPLVLGFVFNAVKFMRFIGYLTGGHRRASGGQSRADVMSFDERVAERLRDLERERSRGSSNL